MKKSWLFLTALFVSISATASIDALNFASPEQEKDYHQLTQELRCPQCQNNNIADSNATIAVDMRGKVFELLQEGKKRAFSSSSKIASELTALGLFDLRLNTNKMPINTNKIGAIHNTIVDVVIGGS